VVLPRESTIRLEGDTAVGRAYVSEFGRFRNSSSQLMYAIYHDRYQRTSEGWKFAERVYEIRYLDITPLVGNGRAHGDPELRRATPRSPSQ
jgi:hypothetical protein